jgi:hypothetical protein
MNFSNWGWNHRPFPISPFIPSNAPSASDSPSNRAKSTGPGIVIRPGGLIRAKPARA